MIKIPVGWAWVLASQVPCGLGLSPGELPVGLASLWVPLEGEPGWGHGVEVGGADVDLLGGEEWPLAGKGVSTTYDGPGPLACPPVAALDLVAPSGGRGVAPGRQGGR